MLKTMSQYSLSAPLPMHGIAKCLSLLHGKKDLQCILKNWYSQTNNLVPIWTAYYFAAEALNYLLQTFTWVSKLVLQMSLNCGLLILLDDFAVTANSISWATRIYLLFYLNIVFLRTIMLAVVTNF